MQVRLAKTAGFCMGVRRAVQLALNAARTQRQNIYTIGPLVHNDQVIEMLKRRHIITVKSVEEIPDGSVVLIRAHGIPPDVRQKLDSKKTVIIDATCPHVAKAQKLVAKHIKQGGEAIIVGDEGHAEVVGLLGYTQGRGYVVNDIDDINNLPDLTYPCLVAQTTQNQEKFLDLTRFVKNRFNRVEIFNTICNATFKRQTEAVDLAQQVEAMIIVGGKNSANTTRLSQLCKETGIPVWHIETAEELDIKELSKFKIVGVTAGASTPNWIIHSVMEHLLEIGTDYTTQIKKTVMDLGRMWVFGYLGTALQAFVLTYLACSLLYLPQAKIYSFMVALHALALHLFNRFFEVSEVNFVDSPREQFYIKYGLFFKFIAVLAMLSSLFMAAWFGMKVLLVLSLASLGGLIYKFAIIPFPISRQNFQYRRLFDIPASKDIFISLDWTVVGVILPYWSVPKVRVLNFGELTLISVICLFVFVVSFMRSILFDMKDIQGDQMVGRETIPLILGKEKTKTLLFKLMVILFMLLVFTAWWLEFTFPLLLIIYLSYLSLCFYWYHLRLFVWGLFYDLLVDLGSLLLLIMNIIWNSIYSITY